MFSSKTSGNASTPIAAGTTRKATRVIRPFRKARLFAIPFALALSAAVITQAQSRNPFLDPDGSNPTPQVNPRQTSPTPTPTPAATNAGALTIEQLGQALDSLNYGKNTITDNGETYYSVNISRDTWKFSLTINLSPNGSVIWITSPLLTIPDLSQASNVALAGLLQKNTEIGPMFFQIAGSKHRLQLTEPIANHDMTTALLKANIEDFLKTIQDTEQLWKQETLLPTQHGSAAAPTGQNPFTR